MAPDPTQRRAVDRNSRVQSDAPHRFRPIGEYLSSFEEPQILPAADREFEMDEKSGDPNRMFNEAPPGRLVLVDTIQQWPCYLEAVAPKVRRTLS